MNTPVLSIDKLSRVPLYEQIIENIERQVLLGLLPEETQIPSLRELSAQLDLNPNTIQKAYLELDRRGVVRATPGRGCFILPGAKEEIRRRLSARITEFSELAAILCMAGIPEEELRDILHAAYRQSSTNGGINS